MKEPVAIFSGKSEQGQRGLGFRSLLGNPLDNSIVDKINKYSGRKVHSHWIDWDYNPPESYEDKMLDYWDPVS